MKKNGISMIIFVISIAMILTLVTTFTASYNVIIESSRKREFASELNSVQKAVDQYKFMNNEYPVVSDYILSLNLTNREDTSNEKQFYVIDFSKLDIDELQRGTSGDTSSLDIYGIDKDEGKVYYLAGVQINKDWYYTLDDNLRKLLND